MIEFSSNEIDKYSDYCDYIRELAKTREFSKKFHKKIDNGNADYYRKDKFTWVFYWKDEVYEHPSFYSWLKMIERNNKLEKLGI